MKQTDKMVRHSEATRHPVPGSVEIRSQGVLEMQVFLISPCVIYCILVVNCFIV